MAEALAAAVKEELPWPDDDTGKPEAKKAVLHQTQQPRVPSSVFMSPTTPAQQQTPHTGGNTRVRSVDPAQQTVRFEPDDQYQGGVRLAEQPKESRYPSLSRYPSIVNRRTTSNAQPEQPTSPAFPPRKTTPALDDDIYNVSPDIPLHRPRAIRPLRLQTPTPISHD